MSTKLQTHREIIRRYTDQPDELPATTRAQIEEALGGDVPQLYGLADLNASLQLARTWVALGPEHLVIVQEPSNGGRPPVTVIPRGDIKHVEETPGLSCTRLAFLGDPDQPALAVVRYSSRQRAALGAIVFVLKQTLEGNLITPKDADAHYAEAIAEPIKTAQASVAQSKLSVLWRLASYMKPYKWAALVGFLAALAQTFVMMVPPQLTQNIIDDAVNPYLKGELTRGDALSIGWKVILVLVGFLVLREIALWARLRILSVMGEKISRDLRRDVYSHMHRLSSRFFSQNTTGSLITRVSSDTERIWDLVAFGVAELLLAALMLVVLSIVLIAKDWQLGLVLVVPVPLMLMMIFWMGSKMHRVFLRIWHKWGEMTAVLGDTIPGMRVVQAFNQGDHERGRFNQRINRYLEECVTVHRIWTTYWPMLYFGISAMTVAVWAFALPRMVGGPDAEPSLTIGEFTAYLLYVGLFVWPLENFGFLTRMINRSLSSAHRVFEVLDTEPEIVSKPDAVKLEPVQGRITFKDVTFGYDPVRIILKGISFDVHPGEMIGLVGPSGAGKTTVVNLIARFYDVNSGSITVDGHNIRDLELGHYRQQIGMVMQDPYLFHGSIVDNIRYGQHEASLEAVIAAARAANAHDFILKLPNGYDTMVGERGHTLSGGERQRVSIARAILHNPRILILDEATSSVDTETERKIQEAIDRLIAGRTVFAIAHRLSTLAKANRLFVMKDGKIVEQGKHGELLAVEDGVYKKLHDVQRELHEMYAV